jgi:protein-tyrosine phosphatase
MGEAGRYLLVELPNAVIPHGLVTGLFNLRIAGVEPVLAHAERYPWAMRDPLRLGPLAQTDIPFQVTTRSITGGFGPESQRAAFELLERGWVHIAASDAHSPRSRPPAFREAVRVLSRRYGKEAARRLCIENPRRLMAGEPLLQVACVRKRFFLG